MNDSIILSEMLGMLPYYVFWKDKNLVFRGCNALFAEQFNYETPDNIIGKTDNDFPWSIELREKYKNDDLYIISTGKPLLNLVEEQKQNDGSIKFLLVSKVPVLDKQKNIIGILGAYTDITEIKKIQQELEIAKSKAEAESKAKSAFIANMSHDLRTPLTGIVGMAQDMLVVANQNITALKQPHIAMNADAKTLVMDVVNTVQEDAKILTNSADELVQLCNEIIDTVSLESGKSTEEPEAFNIRELVSDIVELLLPAAKNKGLTLSYQIDKNVPTFLSGIRVYLDRNLLNLISNAIKFTKQGFVKIAVTLAEENIEPLFALGDKVNLAISIEDSGIGIPKDKFETVFGHFSRLHPSYQGIYKGAGLGLHMVKQYTTIMGGTVTLESTLEKGSTFTMRLSFTVSDHADRVKRTVLIERKRDTGVYHTQPTSKPASAAISPAPAQNLVSISAKILIVEDGVAAAATLQKNLLRHYRVDSDIANDGLNALDKIKTHDYALILMDIGLPDTTGIELTKTIRALTIPQATVPIVAITGHANNPQIAKEALSSGMQAVLDKPPGCDELNIMLKRYVFNKQSTEETIPAVVIDWADHLALFDNDEAFTKQLFVMLSESLLHFKETMATYSEHDKVLQFELHRLAGEVSYFELPQLQKAIGKYQQLVNQDTVTLDAADSLIKTIDAHLASINAGLASELS